MIVFPDSLILSLLLFSLFFGFVLYYLFKDGESDK